MLPRLKIILCIHCIKINLHWISNPIFYCHELPSGRCVSPGTACLSSDKPIGWWSTCAIGGNWLYMDVWYWSVKDGSSLEWKTPFRNMHVYVVRPLCIEAEYIGIIDTPLLFRTYCALLILDASESHIPSLVSYCISRPLTCYNDSLRF